MSEYFNADHPIERCSEDRLGRWVFADKVAQQLRLLPAEHGFTVALTGEWGSGKTSVLNMVAEALEDDKDKIAVLRFNPWLFNGTNDLITLFFRELSAQLGQNELWKLKKVARVFTALGQVLAPLSPVPGTTEAAKLAADKAEDWIQQPSLRGRRNQLEDALEKSDARIVVLIDDIDRLEPLEIRELMRLIRLTSDLPNIVFLLAFDRQRVAKSLDQDEVEGAKYLDKIIQINYNIPDIRKSILERHIFASLDNIIQSHELAPLDREVWQNVYYEIVRPLIRTIRDVKRYVNTLPSTFDIIGEEVALADLLGLEAVRILRPQLFDILKAHADYLVDSDSSAASRKHKEIRDKERQDAVNKMIEQAGYDTEVMKSVLNILFPEVAKSFGHGWYGPSLTSQWRAQRRVACEDVLRTYLQGGVEEGVLPLREVKDLVEALTDEEKLTQMLDGLDARAFEQALERLEDFEQDFSINAASVAVPVLANRMGRLSDHSSGMLLFSPRVKASRIIYRLVRTIDDPKSMMAIMRAVLDKVNTLSGWLCLIELVGHRKNVGHQLVSEEDARDLENQLVERLQSATTEQLIGEWNLCILSLRTFWNVQDRDRLSERLREHLKEVKFVLALLHTAVNYAYRNGHAEKRIHWDALIEVFGDELQKAVDRLAHSQLRQELSQDYKDTISLAQEYASGWRPKDLLEGIEC